MEKRFDLVLFDLDGTLIDNRIAVRENVNFALNKFGFDSVPGPKIDAQIGKFLPKIFEALISKEKWDLAEAMSLAYRERYTGTRDSGLVILDGALEALVDLRRMEISAGVVTNKVEGVAALLKKIDLYEQFEVIISPTVELRPKPNPDMILRALEIRKTSAKRVAYVGDTAIDVSAAKNARVSSIAVMTGVGMGIANQKELRESRPDATIKNLSGLAKVLVK